ncbi:hypothetical protein [Micromonospora globbae]|uniref:hypothetical protein n=1 Tax=Micromonospora globbae TaxID=1894969 RepID=UPI0011C48A85|nr:hypothetical protein [Micromonospora globbae]
MIISADYLGKVSAIHLRGGVRVEVVQNEKSRLTAEMGVPCYEFESIVQDGEEVYFPLLTIMADEVIGYEIII